MKSCDTQIDATHYRLMHQSDTGGRAHPPSHSATVPDTPAYYLYQDEHLRALSARERNLSHPKPQEGAESGRRSLPTQRQPSYAQRRTISHANLSHCTNSKNRRPKHAATTPFVRDRGERQHQGRNRFRSMSV